MSTGVKTHRITDPNDDTRFVDVDPYVVEGVPRFEATIDQTASGHPARTSMNLSSTTDEQEGDTSMTFTNDFASSDWTATGSAGTASSQVRYYNSYVATPTTSSHRAIAVNSSITRTDADYLANLISGELLA
jgi:hypothetical protein